jgi:hypothetical protein
MSDNVELPDIVWTIPLRETRRRPIMIKRTRSDSAKNMHRFYALQLAATLFDEWVVVAEWGRIGSPGRVQEH